MRMSTVKMQRTQGFGVNFSRIWWCGTYRYELELMFLSTMIIFYFGERE
jgi:hypothetical protein